MFRDKRQYHWAERWRWLEHSGRSYMRRRTDGVTAPSYYEAAAIEAAERGITRSQFLKTEKYKWLTLAEITPPVESTMPEVPTSASGAEGISPPGPSYDTTQPIGNSHYHRADLMTAQISIGSALIVLGVALAVLTGLPVLLSLVCAALGGALLTAGLSNRRKPQ